MIIYDDMNIVVPLKGSCWSCADNCAHRSTNCICSSWRVNMCIHMVHKAKIGVLFSFSTSRGDYFIILNH